MIEKILLWMLVIITFIPAQANITLPVNDVDAYGAIICDSLSQRSISGTATIIKGMIKVDNIDPADSDSLSQNSTSRATIYITDSENISGTFYYADIILITGQKSLVRIVEKRKYTENVVKKSIINRNIILQKKEIVYRILPFVPNSRIKFDAINFVAVASSSPNVQKEDKKQAYSIALSELSILYYN